MIYRAWNKVSISTNRVCKFPNYSWLRLTVFSAIDERLNRMRYSTNARFNSEKVCLPNTQTVILDKIFQWVASDTLSASDGDGEHKSTIANTIAQRLFAMKRLGASFCFSRDDRINRNAANMFSTIARGMADLDPCFKVKLAEALDDRGLCTSGKFMSINLVIFFHL